MISHADSGGGADRAAYRILRAVRSVEEDAELWVTERRTQDPAVFTFEEKGATRSPVTRWLADRVSTDLLWLQKSSNSVHRSFNLIDSGLLTALKGDVHDVVHLHWMGSETASVREIGAIPGPVVWTIHDSWSFTGAEHHPEDQFDERFRLAYTPSSRRPGNSRVDLDAWTFRRKQRHFASPRWLVGPSQWMVNQARSSTLAADWPTSVIPNPIDVDTFAPQDRRAARHRWEGRENSTVILFGALGGAGAAAKGWDLMEAAVRSLGQNSDTEFELWVFGSTAPSTSIGNVHVRGLGHISSPDDMASVYSAADVHVIASRQESFSQTAAEATACGTPVVSWSIGGLLDVVEPGVTGVLATPFDPHALAQAIRDAVTLAGSASVRGPQRAHQLWSPAVVGHQYAHVYQEAIDWWSDRHA